MAKTRGRGFSRSRSLKALALQEGPLSSSWTAVLAFELADEWDIEWSRWEEGKRVCSSTVEGVTRLFQLPVQFLARCVCQEAA